MNCKFCQSTQIKNYLKANNFEIKVCKNCRIAFTYPSPILPKYEEMDFHGNNSETGKKLLAIEDLPYDWQKSLEIEIELIIKYIPQGGKITEIGCGEGLFLNELKRSGFETFGIEPSASAVERAKDRNLNIEEGYFPIVFPKEKQDLFILSHVFEHIEEPDFFIKNISKYLKHGGFILFAQTNYKGLIPRIQKEKWYAWVPEHHFWHFSLKGLSTYLRKNNFLMYHHVYKSLVHPHNSIYKLASLKQSWIDQFIALYRKQN